MKDKLDTPRAIFADAPFVVDLGIVPTSLFEGRCEAERLPRPRHRQHTGQAHASAVTSFADQPAGAAAQTCLPEGLLALTAEPKISLPRPSTGERRGRGAVVVEAGRTRVFTEVEVHTLQDGRRRLVGKPSATMAVVKTA